MKNLLLFFGLVLGGLTLRAELVTRTVVVSPEDVLAGKAPLTCSVSQRDDGRVTVGLRVPQTTKTVDRFEGFELRVLKKPIAAADIGERVLQKEFLAWRVPTTNRSTRFVLTEEEAATAYIVARWSIPPGPNETVQVKNVCFEVKALVEASRKQGD